MFNKKGIYKGYLVIMFLSLVIGVGGFLSFSKVFPTSVSADTTFREAQLEGINNPNTVTDEQNNIEVYKAVSPGVVLITTKEEKSDYWGERDEQSGSGSGVIIDAKGYILTNEHVVRGGRKLSVNLGGDKVYPATMVGSDPDTDLAVIKIDAPDTELTVVPFGDSDALTVGQKVLAIGNPFGLDRTLTTGVISGLQRPIRARNGRPIEGAIQTDASINPGNSGGPLLDKLGRVIGINSQILSPSGGSNGIGFAIPVSIVKRIVPQLISSGKVVRPRLGVGTKSVEELLQQGVRLPVENGLLVITVAPNSSAEKAGLQGISRDYDGEVILGDIITGIEGKPIKSIDELYKVLDGKKVGDTITLEVFRNKSKKQVSVKLEAQGNTETFDQTPKSERKEKRSSKY